ncbi:MAG: SIR2 family protein [Anaerolineaceae bacterium]|nr:SIR2 family protein [Anaerolineaceae bacterium]
MDTSVIRTVGENTSNRMKFDVTRELNELRNQISVIKRVGFFFGAGTSMAIGIPGIITLTNAIKSELDEDDRKQVKFIEDSLKIHYSSDTTITVEDILNQLRLIRQITRDSSARDYMGICGDIAKSLDIKICRKIYEIITHEEDRADYSITKKLLSWVNWLSRDFTKEIFTTNYDMVFEKSFESLQIPYFDGFVGANEPFFLPDSIETRNRLDAPPVSWIRLWKIHGSLGWFWKNNPTRNNNKVVRLGVLAKVLDNDNDELVIYPSKEKYELSRKQPFLAFFDRLKRYLLEGEGLFLISGYSFSDEHINDIFFNALHQNNRLHIIAFLFSDTDMKKIIDCGISCPNFTAYSPTMANISANSGSWDTDAPNLAQEDKVIASFWDKDKKQFKLGEYMNLVNFFVETSGKEDKIFEKVGGK